MQRQETLQTRKRYSKAFALRSADDSQGVGIYTRDKGSIRAGGFPPSSLPGEVVEHILSCLSSIEDKIDLLAYYGQDRRLSRACKKYCYKRVNIVRELVKRGVL